MKKIIKKMIFFGVYVLLMTIIISMFIDPYNVFHPYKLRNNGIEPNKNYIKMKYIIANPDRYDSLLFGSSRVGSIHVENIDDERCYNMTYSAGVPSEHLKNIKTLVNNNIIPKKIYIGLDSFSYTVDAEKHNSQPMRCPYEYSLTNPKDFYLLYLNPAMAVESFLTTSKYKHEEGFVENFYKFGWWCGYNRKTKMDWNNARPTIGKEYYLDETLNDIREILSICDENGIELVVFTNPMHKLTYEASIEMDYLLFLKELSKITPYYNFSGINEITSNNDNYIDTSHYNAYVGDIILDCICKGKIDDNLYQDGFGMYVDRKNVDELLTKLTDSK